MGHNSGHGAKNPCLTKRGRFNANANAMPQSSEKLAKPAAMRRIEGTPTVYHVSGVTRAKARAERRKT